MLCCAANVCTKCCFVCLLCCSVICFGLLFLCVWLSYLPSVAGGVSVKIFQSLFCLLSLALVVCYDRNPSSVQIIWFPRFPLSVVSARITSISCASMLSWCPRHERCRDINGQDGFEKECVKKYNTHVFDLFSDVFACTYAFSVVALRVKFAVCWLIHNCCCVLLAFRCGLSVVTCVNTRVFPDCSPYRHLCVVEWPVCCFFLRLFRTPRAILFSCPP